MRDTTAKHAAMRRDQRARANRSRPAECTDCAVPMVTNQTRAADVPEGYAKHGARGFCERCYYRRRRDGDNWDGPAPASPLRWKAADLVAEWELLRDTRGCDREQAAKILGVRPSTIGTCIMRARRYAERDRLRAEIAAAETEAHHINDSMIIREDVAA